MGLVKPNGETIKAAPETDENVDRVENYLSLAESLAKKKFSVVKTDADYFGLIVVNIASLIQREYHFNKEWGTINE